VIYLMPLLFQFMLLISMSNMRKSSAKNSQFIVVPQKFTLVAELVTMKEPKGFSFSATSVRIVLGVDLY